MQIKGVQGNAIKDNQYNEQTEDSTDTGGHLEHPSYQPLIRTQFCVSVHWHTAERGQVQHSSPGAGPFIHMELMYGGNAASGHMEI